MNDGSVFACGRAKEGQLNINPENEMALTPINISAPGRGIRYVAATTLGTIVASDKQVFVIGKDVNGELGLGEVGKNATEFTELEMPFDY